MTLRKTSLSETAIAVPTGPALGLPGEGLRQHRLLKVRAWLLTALLLALPLLTYWPTTFHDFGLRDDYSNLREAHEEIGKVVQFCASHARPIYGWLLQATYGQTSSVQNLQWMRFLAALLLGAISLVSFRGLRSLGWSFNTSLCFAVLLSLVPSAQVIASWAVGWPYAATALLAIAGFFTVDGALTIGLRAGLARALSQWLLAACLMVVAGLIYQPSALFYVVPLAAALLVQRHRDMWRTLRWAGIHLAVVTSTLALSYCIMTLLYATGVFVKSGRIAFEHHWSDKIFWFLLETLPNALSLFVINDNNQRDHLWYFGCAAGVGVILLAGAALEWRRYGRARGAVWLGALLGLPTFACAISLVASEHYATYRTVFAMTAVLLCFLVASVAALTEKLNSNTRRIVAVMGMSVAFLTAQHHAYALIAVPQGNEWQLILTGAKNVRLDIVKPRIFAIKSSPADISTASIYHDEFGSLSSNSEWVPREMFKRAMHDLHPDVANLDSKYSFESGPMLPAGQQYDVIIDLHRLRQFYTNN